MRKFFSLTLILLLIGFVFTACGKKAESPKAGSADATDMLKLVPVDAVGVFMIDAGRAMSSDFASKTIQASDEYEKYQEFITKTGIDPQKDIHYVTAAITGTLKGNETKGGAIINMKYDKEKLLALMEEKAREEETTYAEEDYNGMTLYSWEDDKENMSFAFLDSSNLLAGNTESVKSIIDVVQGRKEDVSRNQPLSDLIAASNKNAMVWGGMLISSDALDAMKSGNPMLSDLDGISAVTLFLDIKAEDLLAEVKLMNADAEKNTKIEQMLTGFKALGSMAAAEKPEVGQLMDAIVVSSGADHVKINLDIPLDVIAKLSKDDKKKDDKEKEN